MYGSMSEAKVQIVSTHLKNQKTHFHVFFVFAGCNLTTVGIEI